MDPDRLEALIELVHHRWNVPVLAELSERIGAKFVSLVNALSVSRASLSKSLSYLTQMGLVMRNPGHGHPMRPEYVLTETVRQVGARCEALMGLLSRRRDTELALRKWTLPLIAAIGTRVMRFNELRAALTDASPRAVTLGLKALVERRWIKRSLVDDYPPTAGYELTPAGRRILDCIGKLSLC